MRIALVHYHLRPGGVTRVIRNAAVLLAQRGLDVLVLSGEPPAEPWPVPVGVVPGLGYTPGHAQAAADGLALSRALHGVARRTGSGGAPDLWHFHNPNLGKNAALPFAISRAVADGTPLVIQIHDFAEDGRPASYAGLRPALEAAPDGVYPVSPNVQYAVINRRDLAILRSAGADPDCVHYLPHPAAILDTAEADDAATAAGVPRPHGDLHGVSAPQGCIAFAPVRGIRRKNVGELALLALLDPDNATYVTSLSVRDGDSATIHADWERYFAETGIPVKLGGAEPQGCIAYAQAARNFVTTSVSEGFGLVILESLLFQRPLAGRHLREVNPLGPDAGPALYDRLRIPHAWVPGNALHARITEAMRRMWAAYGRQPTGEDLHCALGAISDSRGIDFGGLDESLQRIVLDRVQTPAGRAEVHDLNPDVNLRGISVAGQNPSAGLGEFSAARYAARLLAIYRAGTAVSVSSRTTPPAALSQTAILDAFLTPARFRLLLA